jgi:hypothetical protein
MEQAGRAAIRKPRKIRYDDLEWRKVEARAHACGLPPATYVRKASLGVRLRARRNRVENDLILQLGRIGMELRGLAQEAERAGELPARDRLQAVLEEVLAAVRRVG